MSEIMAMQKLPTAAECRARDLRRVSGWHRWLGMALSFFALLVLPIDAFAYLDPGTGSILLQGLIAAVAAAGTFVSVFWQKIKGWWNTLIRGRRRSSDDDKAPR